MKYYTIIQIFGIISAVRSIYTSKTPRGATAWALSLVAFPIVSLPFYWIVAERNFTGHMRLLKNRTDRFKLQLDFLTKRQQQNQTIILPQVLKDTEIITNEKFIEAHQLQLHLGGEELFQQFCEMVDSAKSYLLIQFYIVEDGVRTQHLFNKIKKRAKEGLPIYFLFDSFGSLTLSSDTTQDLKNCGVNIASFSISYRKWKRFQLNYRNHRKMILMDGQKVILGGANLGDEYLGGSGLKHRFEDLMVTFSGPAVTPFEIAFYEDWYWEEDEVPLVPWQSPVIITSDEYKPAVPSLPLCTGPADIKSVLPLVIAHLISSAKKSVTISTPYFTPDHLVMSSLILASSKGVKVKILIPEKNDRLAAWFASLNFVHQGMDYGIEGYLYQHHFIHQKCMIIDDEILLLGSANFDARSLHLNFEYSMVSYSPECALQLSQHLQQLMSQAVLATPKYFSDRGILFNFLKKVSYLFSPLF